MHNLGTLALEEGGRVDFARLRGERLERALAEMARRGLDVQPQLSDHSAVDLGDQYMPFGADPG